MPRRCTPSICARRRSRCRATSRCTPATRTSCCRAFLASIAEHGRNVDFALVDGDHTPEGVWRDVEDLLDSRAAAHTVILIHDTANERVRRGLDAVHFAAWPKVAARRAGLDPRAAVRGARASQRAVVRARAGARRFARGSRTATAPSTSSATSPPAPLLAEVRELVLARERVPPGARSARAGGDRAAQAGRLAEYAAAPPRARARRSSPPSSSRCATASKSPSGRSPTSPARLAGS